MKKIKPKLNPIVKIKAKALIRELQRAASLGTTLMEKGATKHDPNVIKCFEIVEANAQALEKLGIKLSDKPVK